ncbi:MAG: rhomboid family intramembrane serine protease [Anaerolineales bacterium]
MNRDLQGSNYPESDWRSPPDQSGSPQLASVKVPSVSPTVTYTILVITVIVFLLQEASKLMLGYDLPALMGMKINEFIAEGQFWRLFTPMLLHGNLMHIGFNMYALHLFGPGLERHFGHLRFLSLYILAGFAGNVFSMTFSSFPSLGSSTAIFGLLGAQGVFLYQNREVLGGLAQRALSSIVLIAGINLLIGMSPGIDNWGHMGGLVGGSLFAWFAGPVLQLKGSFPYLTMVDLRENREVIMTGLVVMALFLIIAAWRIINFN